MDNERIMLGALIFILIIVGANALMYGIVRGMMKGGESKWMSSIRKSLNKPWEGPANKDMDELRKRMDELQGKDGEKKG
jgi:hypothetical protein